MRELDFYLLQEVLSETPEILDQMNRVLAYSPSTSGSEELDASPLGIAREAIGQLKTAVLMELKRAGKRGLKNSELGRNLEIYGGHKGHEGHISRTVLAILESEDSVWQDPEMKVWRAR